MRYNQTLHYCGPCAKTTKHELDGETNVLKCLRCGAVKHDHGQQKRGKRK